MDGKTRFADDATLAYIAELRSVLKECRDWINDVVRPSGNETSVQVFWARGIEIETKARNILDK